MSRLRKKSFVLLAVLIILCVFVGAFYLLRGKGVLTGDKNAMQIYQNSIEGFTFKYSPDLKLATMTSPGNGALDKKESPASTEDQVSPVISWWVMDGYASHAANKDAQKSDTDTFTITTRSDGTKVLTYPIVTDSGEVYDENTDAYLPQRWQTRTIIVVNQNRFIQFSTSWENGQASTENYLQQVINSLTFTQLVAKDVPLPYDTVVQGVDGTFTSNDDQVSIDAPMDALVCTRGGDLAFFFLHDENRSLYVNADHCDERGGMNGRIQPVATPQDSLITTFDAEFFPNGYAQYDLGKNSVADFNDYKLDEVNGYPALTWHISDGDQRMLYAIIQSPDGGLYAFNCWANYVTADAQRCQSLLNAVAFK